VTGVAPERHADVIVVGGGPAGSVLAWDLARRGIATLLLERARFPREKVCGDYVEPRGLRILERMGCLEPLTRSARLPISRTAIFAEWERCYSGPIPFYGIDERLPSHGFVIPREELDAVLLEAAVAAGASVQEETAVTGVSAGSNGVEVSAEHSSRTSTYHASLVVGADGANSVVARSQGLSVDDPRRTVVARRSYAQAEGEISENAVFFDESLFPGYGWVFPMPDGRVNLGMGLLSETRQRLDVPIPALFERFLAGLRAHYPSCATMELSSRPIGGIVRTYGAAGPNHFDGGLLVGEAGCFVDPMTGEGITPAMESALLASATLAAALAAGEFHAGKLSAYETAFREYFDPSWSFLSVCAATYRNRHLASAWLKALVRGCELGQADTAFARTVGSFFGGHDVQPVEILTQVSARVLEDVLLSWPRLLGARVGTARETTPTDLIAWQTALARSLVGDPLWHAAWMMDVQKQWSRWLTVAGVSDPRIRGVP
jgi:menaquinone-9 beta-reductase